MTNTEVWRPIPGWEGRYEVSNHGRVQSLWKSEPRILAQHPSKSGGYPTAHLVCRPEGRSENMKVHRAVLLAFVGPCPEGFEGCHNNGDPTDNRLSNLRWDTKSANMRDKVRHGRHHNAILTACPQGHPYDDENTYRPPTKDGLNIRHCRECVLEAGRRYRARLRARRNEAA